MGFYSTATRSAKSRTGFAFLRPFSNLPVIFVMTMKRYCSAMLILVILFVTSCEKGVDFKLEDVTPKLVVEATIENGGAPIVWLSKSQAYFSQIDLTALANSFVRNAEVYVSNGTLTHKLKEYTLNVGPGINFYYYSNDPASPSTAFVGQLNKQYSLRVVAEGKEYTAVTTIPNITRRIDSVFWKPAPAGNPPEKVALMMRGYDPPGFGDYIRYFTKRNSEPFYPGISSVFDDQVIDGSSYEVQVERGVDRNGSQAEGYTFFNRGDTVTLKLCNIDKATYDFWRTMEFTYLSVGNPFSSPAKVISNIREGGLGYFGGYAVQFRTIIIPQ